MKTYFSPTNTKQTKMQFKEKRRRERMSLLDLEFMSKRITNLSFKVMHVICQIINCIILH